MRKLLAAIFCASALAAQGSDEPVYGVHVPAKKTIISPWSSAVSVGLTAAEVGKAIAAAAAAHGWLPKLIDEGVIEAKLLVRTHELVVDIAYTATAYTIKYKSSKNLGYDEKRQIIHRNYKVWLKNLDTGIQAALQDTAIQKALTSPSES